MVTLYMIRILEVVFFIFPYYIIIFACSKEDSKLVAE